MMEFLRDVMVAVAILASLIAFALYPGSEPDEARRGGASEAITTAACPSPAAAPCRITLPEP